MTAAIALEKGRPDRSEQLEQLRRQMAAVSGRVGVRSPALEVPESVVTGVTGLPKGVVAVLSGARSLPVSMAAAVRRRWRPCGRRGTAGLRIAGRRGDGRGSQSAGRDPEAGHRPGRSGRSADGWHGSGGARSGRPGAFPRRARGPWWPGPGSGVAPCWLRRVTGRVPRCGWMPGCLVTRSPPAPEIPAVCRWPATAGSARCGCRSGPGDGSEHPGTGHLVHGLVGRGRGGIGRTYAYRSGRGHLRQSGDRLLGGGTDGRGAARSAPPRCPARCPQVHVVPADAARCAFLRERHGRGGRRGASG